MRKTKRLQLLIYENYSLPNGEVLLHFSAGRLMDANG